MKIPRKTTAIAAPTAPQTTPGIKALFEVGAVLPTGEPIGGLAPVGGDVDVVADGGVKPELLAETETLAVETEVTGVEPTDTVLLTVGDVLGGFAVLGKPLTALKGSKSSFKAIPVLGRCWHPSIKACKSIPVAVSALCGSNIVQQCSLTVDKRLSALRCG